MIIHNMLLRNCFILLWRSSENRKSQNKYWLLQTINDKLQSNFFGNEKIKKELEKQYNLLDKNKTTPFAAAEILLKI